MNLKKYFLFKGTISGWSYFWRMWVQMFLIAVFGLGVYLLAVTSYKRASAITNKKWLRILATPTLPFVGISNILLANDSDAEYIAENSGLGILLISLIFVFLHIWLLFFNGKETNHSG